MNPLDFEIVEEAPDDWQVWTPSCPIGSCIGSGPTHREALLDTIKNLGLTITNLADTIQNI